MGRKGPRAKTKIVLKSVKQWEQLGNMHNLKFQTFLNKNHVHSSRDDQTSLKPQTLKNINIKALIQGVTNNRIFDRIIFVLFL